MREGSENKNEGFNIKRICEIDGFEPFVAAGLIFKIYTNTFSGRYDLKVTFIIRLFNLDIRHVF